MNYYTFHSGDYLRDTSHLTLIEDAIYRRLIDWYYTNESPLPNDIKKISRLIRAVDNVELVGVIVEEFFELSENEWRQCRCDEEIAIYHGKAEKARENGKLGGRPKTKEKANHNQEKTESVILDNLEESESKANQEPRTKNQEPNLNNKNNASEDFQKQDESHLYVAPTRRNYCLFVGWKPEPDTWAIKLKASSYRVKPEQFTDYIIAEFVRKNIGEEEKTEHKWQDYLIESVIRGYIKPEGHEAKPTNQPKTNQPPQEDPNSPTAKYDMSNEIVLEKMPVVSKEEKERQRAIIKKMLEGSE